MGGMKVSIVGGETSEVGQRYMHQQSRQLRETRILAPSHKPLQWFIIERRRKACRCA